MYIHSSSNTVQKYVSLYQAHFVKTDSMEEKKKLPVIILAFYTVYYHFSIHLQCILTETEFQ